MKKIGLGISAALLAALGVIYGVSAKDTVVLFDRGIEVPAAVCAYLETKGGTCEDHYAARLDSLTEQWAREALEAGAAEEAWCLGSDDCGQEIKDAIKAARAAAKAAKLAAEPKDPEPQP